MWIKKIKISTVLHYNNINLFTSYVNVYVYYLTCVYVFARLYFSHLQHVANIEDGAVLSGVHV